MLKIIGTAFDKIKWTFKIFKKLNQSEIVLRIPIWTAELFDETGWGISIREARASSVRGAISEEGLCNRPSNAGLRRCWSYRVRRKDFRDRRSRWPL